MKRFRVGDKFMIEDLFGGNPYGCEVKRIWTEKALDGLPIKYMTVYKEWQGEDKVCKDFTTYIIREDDGSGAESIKVWEYNGAFGLEYATNEEKEDESMRMFKLGDTEYKTNDKGNYFYKSTGKTDKHGYPVFMRIPAHVFEKAFEEYVEGTPTDWEEQADAEYEARQKEQEKKDRETEERFNGKKAKKVRRSKDVAVVVTDENGRECTITKKQEQFLRLLVKTSFYEEGLESTLWCDCIAQDIDWNPMSVGAMISTLREKHLITVDRDGSRQGKPKYMTFTDLGKVMMQKMGLN